eukprot:Unigene8072_Nuclearia_a/m.24749 Unigene8072_Nuclearia_a/g.24749  ORF Unigene8072_Nuclearia_a/g.24749 Unigene8072_Nuclearia_a/m.24749 type:complete len:342 (-) Unigene8072_Nuclearia_a:67-1092(-)
MTKETSGLSARRRGAPLSLQIRAEDASDSHQSPTRTSPLVPSASAVNSANTPDTPAQILPYLYLGGEQHASSLKVLEEHAITAIFNVAAECERKRFEERFDYFALKVSDKIEEDIRQYFQPAFDYIEKVRTGGGRVLVHCSAGKSRSPTIVMAYLIHHKQWTLQHAYEYVKTRRRICPNLGFMLVLSEFEKATLDTTPEARGPRPTQTLRVLLVEDEESHIEPTVAVVTKLGHVCQTARNGSDAVELVRETAFDVILMDLSMPGMNGFEATRRIRQLEADRGPAIIIALKGEEDLSLLNEEGSGMPSGMDGFLNKPLSLEVLEASLKQQLLSRRKSELLAL